MSKRNESFDASNPLQSTSPTGPAGGDLSGTYPNPTVVKVNGASVPASATVLGSNASRQLVDDSALVVKDGDAAGGDLSGTYPNPTVAKVNGLAIPASATVLGSNASGQLVDDSVWAVGYTNVSGEDFYIFPYAHALSFATTTSTMGTANHVRAFRFNLDRRVTFTRIAIYVTTSSNGNNEYIGIYDRAGNRLLSVQFPLTAATGVYVQAIASFTMNPGTYFLVRGADQTVSVLAGMTVATNPYTLWNTATANVSDGDCANVIAAGSLPATLGTISTSGATQPPVVAVFSV